MAKALNERILKIILNHIKSLTETKDPNSEESRKFLSIVKTKTPDQVGRFRSLITNKGLNIAKDKYNLIDPDIIKLQQKLASKELKVKELDNIKNQVYEKLINVDYISQLRTFILDCAKVYNQVNKSYNSTSVIPEYLALTGPYDRDYIVDTWKTETKWLNCYDKSRLRSVVYKLSQKELKYILETQNIPSTLAHYRIYLYFQDPTYSVAFGCIRDFENKSTTVINIRTDEVYTLENFLSSTDKILRNYIVQILKKNPPKFKLVSLSKNK